MVIIAKYSTVLTVIAATGFLIGAILTDNGSSLAETDVSAASSKMANQRNDVKNGFDVSSVLKALKLNEGKQNRFEDNSDGNAIDRIITANIERVQRDERKLNAQKQREIQDRINSATFASVRNKKQVKPDLRPSSEPVSGPVIIVKSGDTLYGIGLKHGLTIAKIASLNGLSEPYTVKIGQKLRVN